MSLERIRKFHLTGDMFSVDNNLLTPTFKIKRNIAKKVFAKEIEEMYNEPL
jgi:long-chain acyl-CoA synthetase